MFSGWENCFAFEEDEFTLIRLNKRSQAETRHEFGKKIINLFWIFDAFFINLGAGWHHWGVLLQNGFDVCDLVRLEWVIGIDLHLPTMLCYLIITLLSKIHQSHLISLAIMGFVETIFPLPILVLSASPNTILIIWSMFIFVFCSVMAGDFKLGVDKLIFIVNFFVFFLDGSSVVAINVWIQQSRLRQWILGLSSASAY